MNLPRVLPALALLVLAGCGVASSSDQHPTQPADPVGQVQPSSVEVVYLVGGSAHSADITYQTPSGSAQQNKVAVPLTMRASGEEGLHYTFPPDSFLYISAQNNGGGVISCTITVDGVTVSHNVAHGSYAIAQCDG